MVSKTSALLVAGALMVGAVVGSPAVQAAGTELVHLVGGGSSHVAKVDASGKLLVNDGAA